MKRMQSTPLISSKPCSKDNNATAVNLSPIFSSGASVVTQNSGMSVLSTFYCEKVDDFTLKTEKNDFSHWLGPKIATTAKNELDGTYVEKVTDPTIDLSNKENIDKNVKESDTASVRPNSKIQLVLSDILNKQNESLPSKSPEKISITVNRQSSSVWLNASRDYAKEPSVETDDKDMEELHTELDKILDQLQKLVT